ncbi:MAG: hypothetical protein AAGD28_11560 [Bacteroidota bacterium]
MKVYFKYDSHSSYPPDAKHASHKSKQGRILPIALDKHGRERIGFVASKLYEQYALFHQDPSFISQLPNFHLPMLGVGSFRAFEIADDSMYPLEPGAIVVGEYVKDWAKIQGGKTCIVLHKEEGLLYRRIYPQKQKAEIRLLAEKKTYPAQTVNLSKIYEIWQARMFMSL